MASAPGEVPRVKLQLWWTGGTDSIFIYYVIGAMTLSFLITMAITSSLRRKQPQVLELLHADNLREMMITYLLSITTSLTKGSSCGDKVKVFVQLQGSGDKHSQFFQLKSNTSGGRPMLKRGQTDIFLLKVPVSLGEITGAKLVLSGAERSISWRVTCVQLYEPHTQRRYNLQTTVYATEILGCGNVTDKVIVTSRPYAEWFLHVCIYHQWLSGYVNTVRFGTFTEMVHVIFTFFTLYTLMIFTQFAYILLPGGTVEDNFELNISSLFIGSFTSSVYTSFFSLGFELLVRHAKSREKKVGSAYETVINENICAQNMAQPMMTSYSDQSAASEQGNFWMAFVMNIDDFDSSRLSSGLWKRDKNDVSREIPVYLAKLLLFIEQEEDRLAELERLRRLDQGNSMLSLTNSPRVRESTVSFLDSIQSLSTCEINLPTFSQICLNRMLSGMSLRVVDEDLDYFFIKPPTKSYMDILVAKLDKRSAPSEVGASDSESQDLSGHITLDLTDLHLNYLTRDSSCSMVQEEVSAKKIPATTGKSSGKKSSQKSGRGEAFTIVLAESDESNITTDELLRSQGKKGHGNVNRREVAVDIEAEDHVVDIEDINMEGGRLAAAATALPDESKLRRRNHSRPADRRATVAEDGANKHDEMPDVKYSSTSVRSVTQYVWKEWQKTQKVWCRKLVQAVHESFKASRTDLMQGILVTSDIDLVLVEWAHEVVKQITIACSLRRVTFEKELLELPHVMHLFSHLSAEIIHLVVNDVYTCLRTSEFVTLAELVLQSHHVMAAVEHATDCIVYIINNGNMDDYTPFKYLDMGQDLVDIRDRFIQMSFELTVAFTDITWAFFLALLRNEDRIQTLSEISLQRLRDYVESQLKFETEEDVIIKKLCHSSEQEAKQEVWAEYTSQPHMFSSILIKQQTLKQLAIMIASCRRRKLKFDQTHDLIPEVPKTRLEKLVEKRRRGNVDTDKEKAKAAKKPKPTEEEIKESKCVSERMSVYTDTLVYLREKVKKKWQREGLTSEIPGAKYLAQALIHPRVSGEGDEAGHYRFDNFLHLKRSESLVKTELESRVLGMAEVLLEDVLYWHDLGSETLSDRDRDFIVNGILVKVDAASDVLVEDVHDFAKDVMARDQDGWVNPDTLRQSSKMLVEDSISNMNDMTLKHSNFDTNFSAKSETKQQGGSSTAKSAQRVDFIEWEKDKAESEGSLATASVSADTVQHDESITASSDIPGQQSIYQELINDLKPLKTYLEVTQKSESLRHETTKNSHLERSREQRDYQMSVCINNIIDSYYLIQEGDDSHTFTRAALYQLEHDLVGESSRSLPAFVKSMVVWTMMLMILGCLVYASVAGGQFSTTEVQEWTCFYLCSVLMFGFCIEPIRAVILGQVFRNWMWGF